jgi:raffinose/stachyose/melibiose transport system substrate-binding protein
MNRFRSRRPLAVAAAVLIALSIALGASAAGGNIEVVSFYPEGASDYTNLAAIAKSFEATHPGSKVTLTFGGGQNAPNIVARWRAGNPPEVNVGFFGPGAAGQEYVNAGQVQDLTAAMNKPLPKSYGYGASTKWKDTILPAVKPWITMGNKYYAVPSEITAVNFFYNRDLFKKYHLTPPKTWAQFLNVCAVLKKNGVAPLTVTGTFAGYMQLYYDYLLARRVGTAPVLSAIAGKTAFSSIPGAVAAATDLQNLVKKGYFLNGFEGTDFTAAQLNFFQGRAGMILMGTWLEGEMKDSIPDGFALGTFGFPTIPGGKGANVLFGAVNARTVAAKSANPAQGIEFLKWFSRKDVQAARTNFLAYLSPFKGVKVGPKYAGVMAALQSKGGSFATDYFGLFGETASVRNAYQLPLVKLMFQKESPADMVKEISDGLQSAQR